MMMQDAIPAIPAPLPNDSFERGASAFDAARQVAAIREQFYRVAGRVIRVRIAGPALADQLEKPMEHLRVEPTEETPMLTIDVWHEAETGIGRPSPNLDSALGPYGIMTASEDRRFVAEKRAHSMSWLDRHTGHAVVWISSLTQLHLDERARPFHRFLALRLGEQGVQFIHAGLVTWQGRGALFTGRGGSGKSTASICCLLSGLGYLGDDFVGLESGEDGVFRGHSLYGTALTTLGHMTRFPSLAAVCVAANHTYEEKSLAWLRELPGATFEDSTTITAIVMPRVVDSEDTTYDRASARDALLSLAPTSVLYLPAAGPRAIDRLAALVERVPRFRLLLGRDVSQIPERVKELLAEAE